MCVCVWGGLPTYLRNYSGRFVRNVSLNCDDMLLCDVLQSNTSVIHEIKKCTVVMLDVVTCIRLLDSFASVSSAGHMTHP